MADVSKILGEILRSPGAKGFAGGLAGGLLAGKAGRKLGKKALELGSIAAVGALAYTAYDRWRRGQPVAAGALEVLPVDVVDGAVRAGFLPAPGDVDAEQRLGLLLVRTMIAAAKADGTLDARETDAVVTAVEKLGLAPPEKAVLLGELARPASIESLAVEATSLERATEVFTAALLAMDADTPEERAWLERLRERLGIDPGLATVLARRLDVKAPDPAPPAA